MTTSPKQYQWEPTHEEIAARAWQVRMGWTEEQEQARERGRMRGRKGAGPAEPAVIPVVSEELLGLDPDWTMI